MNAKLVATVRWRALDREGHDTCRLSQTDDGWMLVGHAEFRDQLGQAELNYIVRCDQAWCTQSVDLAGRHGQHNVRAKILQDDGTWWFGDREQTAVSGARDIDLSFTPATNLMPLRRLTSDPMPVAAAWFQYPCAKLVPLDQTYARSDMDGTVSYHADQTGFAADLTVDRSGFVLLYPDHWAGEVTYAD
ncbi:MAG: putative glycolipid-binding domain-containing protein [Pseudomonadota bacterium]